MTSATGACLWTLALERALGPATGPGRQQRPHGSQWNLTRWTALAGSKGGRCGNTYVVGISKGVRGVCSGLREVGGRAPGKGRRPLCRAGCRGPLIRQAPCLRRPEVAPTTEKRRARVHPVDVFTHHHGDPRSGASAGGVDLRYAAVVAPKARANTGSPGSLHARALSGGRQGGKAGRSRQGAGGGKPRQPAPAQAIGRRWQTPRPFRFDSWLRLPE